MPWDSGVLTLNGSNTYQGTTTIGTTTGPNYYNNANANVTIRLGNANALPYGNNLVFGDDSTQGNTATLDLNGYSPQIANLTGSTNAIIDNSTAGGSISLTVGLNDQTSAYAGTIRNSSGTVSLTKVGSGILTLSGSNSYNGGTTVTGGVLQITTDAQLGAVPSTSTVNITLNGGELYGYASSPSLNANRTVFLGPSGGYIQPWGAQVFTVNGKVTGPGGLGIAWDAGTAVLSSTYNDYQGDTTIGTNGNHFWSDVTANPVLQVGANNALPFGANAGNLVFGSNGTNTAVLDLNGHNVQINGLSGGTNAIVDNIAVPG